MTLVPGTRRVYVVRHGETEWTVSGQHTGRTDIPMTARGQDEARALRPWLERIAFGHVFRSTLRRARRTCELAGLGDQAETEPDLLEWDYGQYEGRRSPDIRKERPGWNVFLDGCPGGEMPGDIAARADALIARLRALDGNIALFTHGAFAVALAARWIGLPVLNGQNFLLGTGALGVLGTNPAHPEVPVIARWNVSPGLLANGV